MKEEKKIHGLTFLEYCNKLNGYVIFNKYGNEISKYLLYWNKIKANDVFLKYIVKNRKY